MSESLNTLRQEYREIQDQLHDLEIKRDGMYARLKAEFRNEFGRWPHSADDHFYLAGGPKPEN